MSSNTLCQGMNNKPQCFTALTRALHTGAQTAENVTQETFLRAWKAQDSLKAEKAAKAWLMPLARRENTRRFEPYTPEFMDLEEQQNLHGRRDSMKYPNPDFLVPRMTRRGTNSAAHPQAKACAPARRDNR